MNGTTPKLKITKKIPSLQFVITSNQEVRLHKAPMTGDPKVDFANTVELIDPKREPDAMDEMFMNHTSRRNIEDAKRWTDCYQALTPEQFAVFERDQELRSTIEASPKWRVCSGIQFDGTPLVLFTMDFKYYTDERDERKAAENILARVQETTGAQVYLFDEDYDEDEVHGFLNNARFIARGENHNRKYRHLTFEWNMLKKPIAFRQQFIEIITNSDVKLAFERYGIEVA